MSRVIAGIDDGLPTIFLLRIGGNTAISVNKSPQHSRDQMRCYVASSPTPCVGQKSFNVIFAKFLGVARLIRDNV